MTPSSVRTVAVLNERSREIFRRIVESYVETGEPVGSRTLSRSLRLALSPATIRNVMADLQEAGLLYAPHTSAGRLPTEAGLRLFVDGLLEIGGLTEEERTDIDVKCSATGRSVEEALAEATSMLSGLADCAGLVFAPKSETPLKHIEFVGLTDGQALVVMVGENGVVENRLIAVPVGIPPSALVEARNFLSARLVGRTLTEARAEIAAELKEHRVQLDQLTTEVVETGLAIWAGESQSGYLIVKGQAKLLENITAIEDLEQIRTLFQALETKETMARLLELAHDAEGVQIFIGADNALFALAGCSMVVAPFANSSEKIVGAIGVIGPTRINYARIIPMVDYTAKVISRVIG